jgi:serine/threonine protein kinase
MHGYKQCIQVLALLCHLMAFLLIKLCWCCAVNLGAGTMPYQAPELLIGMRMGPFAQAVTNRCDIYSLGMMMWEMLSGQPPWVGLNAAAILQEVRYLVGRVRVRVGYTHFAVRKVVLEPVRIVSISQ